MVKLDTFIINRNNAKQLLIKYPVKEGNEVIFAEDGNNIKWVVEKYLSSVEGVLTLSEKANDVIKIGLYVNGTKTVQNYYMPTIGMVKTIMT